MALSLPPWVRSVLGIHRVFTEDDEELTTTSDLQLAGGLTAEYNQTTGRLELASDGNALSIGGIPLEDPFDPLEGQTIQFNGSEWITVSGTGGDATSLQGTPLDATTVGNPDDGDVLVYDDGTGEWIAAPGGGGGDATSLQGIPLDAAAPADNDLLMYE